MAILASSPSRLGTAAATWREEEEEEAAEPREKTKERPGQKRPLRRAPPAHPLLGPGLILTIGERNYGAYGNHEAGLTAMAALQARSLSRAQSLVSLPHAAPLPQARYHGLLSIARSGFTRVQRRRPPQTPNLAVAPAHFLLSGLSSRKGRWEM